MSANPRPIDELARCRQRIDEMDVRLVRLLNDRTAIVEEIGRIKQQIDMPIYEPKREEAVLENVLAHNDGPLSGEALERIFERIIDEMRTLQKLKIVEGKR